MTTSFDRVRPRAATEQPEPEVRGERADSEGKAALFSSLENPAHLGTVTIDCSSCRRRTVTSYFKAARLAFPSIHLPVVHKPYPSWMQCPACRSRTWVRIEFGI